MKKLLIVTMVLLAQLGFSQFPPDDKKFSMPEIPAEYIGGDEAMIKFMAENIKMPMDAPTGTTYISITIDVGGNISNARVIRGFDPGADAEALRVSKLLKFRPAFGSDSKPIEYSMVLPVKFVAKQ
ncbi:MAG: energy transducer TonB [Sphingobacteriales bacterium JAD_PAG50586_3]|nr:MAG: energy transducer TonB [Sphingobacteriales bacterium JAD_PAG50586_3]